MTEHISQADYVQVSRQRAADVATAILNGSIDVIDGSRLLAALQREVEVEANDEDFVTFVAIESETDSLPIGKVRERWAAAALDRMEPEIQSASAWAMDLAVPACRSIVRRFATAAG